MPPMTHLNMDLKEMTGYKRFSIYNNLPGKADIPDSPLGDLMPASIDHGWHVARNLLKPLNHLDFLKRKEAAADYLNLHNYLTPARFFEENYGILQQHHAEHITTDSAVKRLVGNLSQQGKIVTEKEVVGVLRDYASVTHMEFHPTDRCNLRCRGCTYGHDQAAGEPPPVSFYSSQIGRIAELRPRSMVIVGGGEPTLYSSDSEGFAGMINQVCLANPGIRLALVTNGTYKPSGEWPGRFSWIRLSLDAANEMTYRSFRGRPLFDRVIQNYLSYLEHDVRYVGISFLFARSNVRDYAGVARLIYKLVKEAKPAALPRINIQYRPLRRDPYQNHGRFNEAVRHHEIEDVIQEVRGLADSSPGIKTFLRKQTNITAILGGNSHPPHDFARCYYSQIFRIVRANGDLRPCFVSVTDPNLILGNIYSHSLEKMALNTLYVASKRNPVCIPKNCRQCHVNYILEQGLKGNIQPSSSREVHADPMF
jgi:MoaA/NifB/PqqE/SkfB family radical SAM enzyme